MYGRTQHTSRSSGCAAVCFAIRNSTVMAQCRNSTAALGASGWSTRLLWGETYAVEETASEIAGQSLFGGVSNPAGPRLAGEHAGEAASHIGPGTKSPRPPSPPRQAQQTHHLSDVGVQYGEDKGDEGVNAAVPGW